MTKTKVARKRRKSPADIPFDIREKIDIDRKRRFPCDNCCLTESAQYKIMFAEAITKEHDKN